MRTPRRAAGTLGLLLALAGVTGAQESGQVPANGLTFTIGAGGGWDSNPQFVPSGTGSTTGAGFASLSRTWSSPRSSFAAFASGQGQLYSGASVRNRYSYGGGINSSAALGSRTTLGGGVSADAGYTDRVLDPGLSGLVLPLDRTVSVKANASLARLLGTRSQMQLSGTYTSYRFDSQDLTDGASLGATARLSRQLSPKNSLNVSYGISSNAYGTADSRNLTHTLAAGYGRTLSARSKVSFGAGVDFFSEAGAVTRALYAAGTYDLQGQRSGLTAGFSREIVPGFGLGQDLLVNVFGLRTNRTLTRWLSVNLGGTHSLNQNPQDTAQSFTSDEVSLLARASLGRSLSIVPSFQYRRRGAYATYPSVADYRVGMSAEFTRMFR